MLLINILLATENKSTISPITETTTNPTDSTTKKGEESDNAASNSIPVFQIMISAIIIVIASYKLYT